MRALFDFLALLNNIFENRTFLLGVWFGLVRVNEFEPVFFCHHDSAATLYLISLSN
jgi:hypothetical protein